MVVASTRTMASVSSTSRGLGTSSQLFRPGPWYTSACMMTPSAWSLAVQDGLMWWAAIRGSATKSPTVTTSMMKKPIRAAMAA